MRGAAGFWRSRVEDRPFLFRTFLCIFLAGASVLGALLAVFLYSELHAERSILAARELTAVRQGKRAIDQAFDLVTSDLFFFAESPNLQNFIADDSPARRETLASAFFALIRNKHFYRRLCYCADSGSEVVGVESVNGKPVVMAPAAVERADDHCLDASRTLERDEFFVSALPLGPGGKNAPASLLPTLRFYAPVFDRQGKRQGVVSLDFSGGALAEYLRAAMGQLVLAGHGQSEGQARPAGEVMLLDRDGFWVMGPDLGDRWGILAGSHRTLAKVYPEAWQRMAASEQGQFEVGAGLFSHDTVVWQWERQRWRGGQARGPARAMGADGKGETWKLVSWVSRKRLKSFAAPYVRMTGLLYGALLLLLALASWQFARIRANNRQGRRALQASEQMMRTITSVVGEGLYVLDGNGRLLFMNPEAEKLLGWREEELLGKELHRVIHFQTAEGEPLADTACPVLKSIAQGRTCRGVEDVFTRKDGTMVPVSLVSTPIVRDWGIEGSVAAFHDITARQIASRHLERMASTDPLTGICNRLRFEELAENEQLRALRYRTPLSLIMFDIDHFKRINDSCGHQVGDTVLRELSRLVAEHIRHLDVFVRWGGEEFMVLVPNSDLEDGARLAEKLRAMLAASSFECNLPVTCSFGVASFRESDTLESFASRADQAMYRAKRLGRNRVEMEE